MGILWFTVYPKALTLACEAREDREMVFENWNIQLLLQVQEDHPLRVEGKRCLKYRKTDLPRLLSPLVDESAAEDCVSLRIVRTAGIL